MKVYFTLLVFLVSCGSPKKQSVKSLTGKTVEYRYGESVYHVTFDSDSTLHWEAMAGDETGLKENETYVAEWIDATTIHYLG
jgi:hypothetical protein